MPDVFVHLKRFAIVFWGDKLTSLKEMRKLELFIICFEIRKTSFSLNNLYIDPNRKVYFIEGLSVYKGLL